MKWYLTQVEYSIINTQSKNQLLDSSPTTIFVNQLLNYRKDARLPVQLQRAMAAEAEAAREARAKVNLNWIRLSNFIIQNNFNCMLVNIKVHFDRNDILGNSCRGWTESLKSSQTSFRSYSWIIICSTTEIPPGKFS